MTNTKFRKRALVSSVAMLLVAMLALSSATFAWFVQNPTAKATGLQMKVTAAPGLVILSASDYLKGEDFDYTTDLAPDDMELQPASPYIPASLTSYALTFASIQAEKSGVAALDDSLTFGGVGSYSVATYVPAVEDDDSTPEDEAADAYFTYGTGAVYYEDIAFKKSGDGSGEVTVQAIGVQINTVNATNAIKNGVRVAVIAAIPGANDSFTYSVIGIWKPEAGTATSTWTNAAAPTSLTADPYSYTDSGDTVKNLTIPVGTQGFGAGARIRAYVYLDGEDENVFSDHALQLTELVSSIKVVASTKNADVDFT